MAVNIEAMRTFVAVCDTRGFAAAARALDMSPPVVTRLVAGLESHLGVRLLQRTTRSVRLTDAGARFLERSRRILADIEEAEISAQDERGDPRGLLVVGAPDLFGRMHVAPVLSRYLALYPQVDVEFRLANRFSSLVEEGIDVAIRIGALADSGMIARGIGATRRLCVASPGYLAECGTPAVPADLAAHRLIVFHGVTPRRDWPFLVDGTMTSVRVAPRFYASMGDPAIAQALAGGGILPALDYQVAAPLKDGRLVEVLAGFAPPPAPIHVLFPTARLLSRKVRAFIDLIEGAASAWRGQETPL